MVVIAVEYRVGADNAAEFRERARVHAANSMKEPGCLRFDVAEDVAEPGHFRIWEAYVDAAAFDFHREQASIATFRDAVGPMAESRAVFRMEMITPLEAK